MKLKQEVLQNSVILKDSLQVIYKIASRRTSNNFAKLMIKVIIETLTNKFNFLSNVQIKEDSFSDVIKVDSEVDSYNITEICKAVEAIIRLVQVDLEKEAGLFFIKEFKTYISKEVLSILNIYAIDFELLQVEQHHLYYQWKKKKSKVNKADNSEAEVKEQRKNFLNYTWNDISTWTFNKNNNSFSLFDKEGKILDQIKTEVILKKYVNYDAIIDDKKYIFISENEHKLLSLLLSKDIDEETALKLLNISNEELFQIIHRLLKHGLLRYANFDEVELTTKCINYLKEMGNL